MYPEDDLLQLSALQHFIFCQRQCALIHIEQVWDENVLTAEGRIIHERAHEAKSEMRDGVRIERGVRLCSHNLGLIGMADVVEFHKAACGWVPFPVEYKHGKSKENDCDRVQLCAQALCLEEMLNVHVPSGALFYGKTRRREDVAFDENLRRLTEDSAVRLHEFIEVAKTPKPAYTPKCKSCSLLTVCMPKTMDRGMPVKKYLQQAVEEL